MEENNRKKYLIVEFSDGGIYKIPGEIIAESRTRYYAEEVDGYIEGSNEWNKEYQYSLDNDDELIDWACNNMNWKDVRAVAELVGVRKADYDEEWPNATKQIVKGIK